MPKDKRDKLLLVCIASVGIISVLYFLVINDMKAELMALNSKIVTLRDKQDKSDRILKQQENFQANLEALRKRLEARQVDMPRPGEDHVWFLRIMEERRTRYNLDINDIKNPELWEPGVLPKFPFKGVAFNVTLIGGYTDFGRFLADFENTYPYMRVQLISITPEAQLATSFPGVVATPQPAAAPETGKLRFNFRVISLIKTQT